MLRPGADPETVKLAGRLTGLTRQTAAQTIHEWLLTVKKEADEPDISAAYRLMDLLDCHRCVQHVAQVYIKGIMGDASPVFGMQSVISETEAAQIVARAAQPELRISRAQTEAGSRPKAVLKRCTVDELQADRTFCIIDVRDAEEFGRGHLAGAVSVPLAQFVREPEALSTKKGEKICFVCTRGVKSRMAAMAAIEAGFENVSYAALNPDD